MAKKDEGCTIRVLDQDGQEKSKREKIRNYLLIEENENGMAVTGNCNLQWFAYALQVAATDLSHAMQQEEAQRRMELAQKKPGIQVATKLPPGILGGKKQARFNSGGRG